MSKKVTIKKKKLKELVKNTSVIHDIDGAAVGVDSDDNDILKLRFTDGGCSVVPLDSFSEDAIRADILAGILMQAVSRDKFLLLMEKTDELASIISCHLEAKYGDCDDECEPCGDCDDDYPEDYDEDCALSALADFLDGVN